jgi:hypothetical protein
MLISSYNYKQAAQLSVMLGDELTVIVNESRVYYWLSRTEVSAELWDKMDVKWNVTLRDVTTIFKDFPNQMPLVSSHDLQNRQ